MNFFIKKVEVLYLGPTAGAYKQYHDLVRNGVDPENIIIISPDSAAFHRRNPVPGLIAYGFDKGEISADYPVNQYEDIKVDYVNWDLEPKDFFNILAGEANQNLSDIGSGRVVNSGPKDNVFLYIHTIACMWIDNTYYLNNWDLLYPEEFVPVIEELAEIKHFKNMYIHMHSSQAGRMYDDYAENNLGIIVYSLGGRYNDYRMCHWNRYFQAYTSSCSGFEHFAYLNNATVKNGAKETVLDLYHGSGLSSYDEDTVHHLYGDLDQAYEPIKEFFGPKMKNSKPLTPAEIMELRKEVKKQTADRSGPISQMLIDETSEAEKVRVGKMLDKIISESIKDTKIPRAAVDEPVVGRFSQVQRNCIRSTFKTMHSKCLNEENQFAMFTHGSKLAKLCTLDISEEKIISAIKKTC